MASNHTEHYHLNQWSLDDPVQMEDFNADNRKVDEALNGLMNSRVRLVTGSYTGTGEYGKEHPTTLTFDFTPKLLFMYGKKSDVHFTLLDASITHYTDPTGGNSTADLHVTWGKNSVSWYNNNSAWGQRNNADTIYHYLIIGD